MVVIKDETTKTLASSNERFSVEIPSETSAELDYVSRRSNEEDSDSTRVSNKIVVDPDQQMPTVEISAVDLLTPTTIDLQPGSEITEVSSAAEVTTKQDNKNVVGHHHNSMTNILFNVCATTKASTVIFKR
jgi:hypothetical protein